MKKLEVVVGLLLGAGLLGACGLAAKAIPPVELQSKNALGLQDKEVSVTFGALPAISAQAVTTSGEVAVSFADGEKPDTKGFKPGTIQAVLKLVDVDVSGVLCNAPSNFDLQLKADGKVFEQSNPNVVANASAETTVKVVKQNNDYVLAAATQIGMNFSTNLIDIVTSGGDNTANVKFTVSSASDSLNNCTVTFKLGEQVVTLKDWVY